MNGLTEVKSTRCVQPREENIEIFSKDQLPAVNNGNRLLGAVADNFTNILSIADKIVNIRALKAQSEARAMELSAEREKLLAEAEAYARRKNADTDSVVGKFSVMREMMRDFNNSPHPNMTAEQFQNTMKFAFELAEGEK